MKCLWCGCELGTGDLQNMCNSCREGSKINHDKDDRIIQLESEIATLKGALRTLVRYVDCAPDGCPLYETCGAVITPMKDCSKNLTAYALAHPTEEGK
jgi:hypothetical protein